jgi:hypothetical protein
MRAIGADGVQSVTRSATALVSLLQVSPIAANPTLWPGAIHQMDHTSPALHLPPAVALNHHRKMRAILRFVPALVACGATGIAMAEEAAQGRVLLQPPRAVIPSPITDRFALTARFSSPRMQTFFRYDDPDNPADRGTPFYLEDTLGLENRMYQGSLDMMFRIGDRHRIHAQFSQQDRRAVETLSITGGPLLFGNSEFDNGDVLHTEMEQRRLDVVYTYSILRRQRIEVGLGFGIHLLQFSGTLSEPAEFITEELDTAGPAASLAGDFSWRAFRRLSLNAEGRWLHARVDDVRGDFFSWRANLQWRAARNMAIGLGYAGTYYQLDSADPEFFSGYLWIYNHGPEAFVRVSF